MPKHKLGPGPGRPKGYKHTDIVRERIRVGYYIARLHKHIKGEIEMSPTQLRAAEILLKKSLPDLSAVEHSGSMEHRHVEEMTDAELIAIAAGGRAGTAAEENGEGEGLSTH